MKRYVAIAAAIAAPWGGWIDTMKVPAPPKVDVRIEACPQRPADGGIVQGCTWPDGPVYIEDPDLEPEWGGRRDARFTLYHELGHQYDFQRGTHPLRQRFRRVAHIRGAWDQPDAYRNPQELFADAYALCALPRPVELDEYEDNGWIESEGYPYRARWRAHRRFCRVLRATG